MITFKSVKARDPFEAFDKFMAEQEAFSKACRYIMDSSKLALTAHPQVALSHDAFRKSLPPEYDGNSFDYIIAHLFIMQIAAFELFLTDLMKYVLIKHPKKVGSATFRLVDLLEATDNDELIQRAINKLLNDLMYKKPIEYLHEISEILSIDNSTIMEHWKIFIEAKARRDLGIHNGWICNETYLRKLREADVTSQLSEGQIALPKANTYIFETAQKILILAKDIAVLVMTKHGAPSLDKYISDNQNSNS